MGYEKILNPDYHKTGEEMKTAGHKPSKKKSKKKGEKKADDGGKSE